jgi:hypothetical protein
MVRPGSFWWEDLTYRATTAEPGRLLKPDSNFDNEKVKNVSRGSSAAEAELSIVKGIGGTW